MQAAASWGAFARPQPRCVPPALGTACGMAVAALPGRHAASAKTRSTPPLRRKHPLYEHALELSRQEDYETAREVFESLLQRYPRMCKAWVSYAQMERRLGRTADPLRMEAARQVLQRGLQLNPHSGCLAQAWGLMELQSGNLWAAVRLLERSVDMDPATNRPVLNWKPVSAAMRAVASASSSRRGRAARTICASAGGAPGAGASGGAGGAASSAAGSAPASLSSV